jgi:hypothetical protein
MTDDYIELRLDCLGNDRWASKQARPVEHTFHLTGILSIAVVYKGSVKARRRNPWKILT